jgi:hypothetical protein
MCAQPVHHAVSIRIGVASSEADEMDSLTAKAADNLSSHVVGAFDQIGHHNRIADAFSTIGPEKAAKLTAI